MTDPNTSNKAVSSELEAVKQGLRNIVERVSHSGTADWSEAATEAIFLLDRQSQRITELEGMVPRWITRKEWEARNIDECATIRYEGEDSEHVLVLVGNLFELFPLPSTKGLDHEA